MFRILKFEIEKGKMFSDVNNFWSRQFQEACLSMNGPAASQALSVSFFSSKVITYEKKEIVIINISLFPSVWKLNTTRKFRKNYIFLTQKFSRVN